MGARRRAYSGTDGQIFVDLDDHFYVLLVPAVFVLCILSPEVFASSS